MVHSVGNGSSGRMTRTPDPGWSVTWLSLDVQKGQRKGRRTWVHCANSGGWEDGHVAAMVHMTGLISIWPPALMKQLESVSGYRVNKEIHTFGT